MNAITYSATIAYGILTYLALGTFALHRDATWSLALTVVAIALTYLHSYVLATFAAMPDLYDWLRPVAEWLHLVIWAATIIAFILAIYGI